MRTVRRLSLGAWLLLVAGCGLKMVDGSGMVVTEERPVSSFTAVSLNGNGKLIINQTGKESLSITADDNLLPYLTSEVHGAQLILGTTRNASLSPSTAVVYKLNVGKLVGIELSGSGDVEAPGLVTSELKVNASGSTRIKISGQADQQDITIAGSGDYQAEDLKSKEVTITITGSGNAVLSASDKLDVTVTGSGSIEYIGDPVVSRQVTGAGSVKKR